MMVVYQMAKGAHFRRHALTILALTWSLVAWMGLPRRPAGETAWR
jgi:hypothetical protein